MGIEEPEVSTVIASISGQVNRRPIGAYVVPVTPGIFAYAHILGGFGVVLIVSIALGTVVALLRSGVRQRRGEHRYFASSIMAMAMFTVAIVVTRGNVVIAPVQHLVGLVIPIGAFLFAVGRNPSLRHAGVVLRIAVPEGTRARRR